MSNMGDVTIMDTGDLGIITSTGIMPITSSVTTTTMSGSIGSITISSEQTEDLMEKWIFNRVTIDHKVQEQELMKLKEVAPDYANEIKENLSKNAARDIIKKMSFTKKHDKDADVHHFIGRVWVFTEEELKQFIKEARSV